MANKSQRVIELEEGIAQAVATLRETPITFIGLQESIDSAVETLSEAYGDGFEENVSGYMIHSDEDDLEDGGELSEAEDEEDDELSDTDDEIDE